MPNPEKSIKFFCSQGLAIRSRIQGPGSPVLSKRADVLLIATGTGLIGAHSTFGPRITFSDEGLDCKPPISLKKGKDSAY